MEGLYLKVKTTDNLFICLCIMFSRLRHKLIFHITYNKKNNTGKTGRNLFITTAAAPASQSKARR